MTQTYSQEFADNLYDQTFQIWANPEIARRQKLGSLSEEFSPWAVQVLMDPDGPESIRFNEEVQGVFRTRPDSRQAKSGIIQIAEFHSVVEELAGFELTEKDPPNAAHITLIRHLRGFFIAFDFRYNAARVQEHILAAREFLDVARVAMESSQHRAFIANLHIATELSAKAQLLMHPDKTLLESKKHTHTQSKYNLYAKQGNTEQRFASLLNRLAGLRNPARYPSGSFQVELAEAQDMLDTAEEMYSSIVVRAPMRAKNAATPGA